ASGLDEIHASTGMAVVVEYLYCFPLMDIPCTLEVLLYRNDVKIGAGVVEAVAVNMADHESIWRCASDRMVKIDGIDLIASPYATACVYLAASRDANSPLDMVDLIEVININYGVVAGVTLAPQRNVKQVPFYSDCGVNWGGCRMRRHQ